MLAPGGHAILSADNRLRLNGLVEPAENPIFVPAKYARAPPGRSADGRPGAIVRLYTPGRVDRWLVAAGLEPERRTTVGFGPFTVFWRPILPDRTSLRLQRGLDHLAEHRVPRLRRYGWHYLVSAAIRARDNRVCRGGPTGRLPSGFYGCGLRLSLANVDRPMPATETPYDSFPKNVRR